MDLLEVVLARSRALGLAARAEPVAGRATPPGVDVWVRIGSGRAARTYAAAVRRGLRPAALGPVIQVLERAGRAPMVVADHVSPPVAEALRARGVAFLDAAGNAFIEQGPVLVWVKGERPARLPGGAAESGRAFGKAGLKVGLALLCVPGAAALPYRELARLAGVAHGTVGWAVAELRVLGFIAEVAGRRRLLQPERLLARWAEAYLRVLRPRLLMGRYQAQRGAWWRRLDPRRYRTWLGGEVAAARLTGQLRPERVTLYAERLDSRLLLDCRLRPAPDGVVEILRRFWRFESGEASLAPMPLVYAELLGNGDPRCRDAAKEIERRVLDGLR